MDLRTWVSTVLLTCVALPTWAQMQGGGLLVNNDYDYSPSYMIDQWDSNKHKLWWCSRGPRLEDVIRYKERASYQDEWSKEDQIVFKRSNGADEELRYGVSAPWEGLHTCDVSVIRGSFPVSGQHFSYALYYTIDDPAQPTMNNRIGLALSNDGKNWTRFPLPVVQSIFPNNSAYGAGQQVAFSADGGSAVHLIHTEVSPLGTVEYFYRYAADAIHFSPPMRLSFNGWGFISPQNPAAAFAPGGSYLYASKVESTHADGVARSIAVYRILWQNMFYGSWEKVSDSGGMSPVELEPGFLTNAYGSVSGFLPWITVLFTCSGQGEPSTWDLCYGNSLAP